MEEYYAYQSDFSYYGGLSSTSNTWYYTPSLTMIPDSVSIDKIRYINQGAASTDLKTYVLKSDLFSQDVKGFGCSFCEDAYNSQSSVNHTSDKHILYDNVNGQTFQFTVIGADGTSLPSGGNITVELTFYKKMPSKQR